ncbi:prephenate dehydrogenase/arogenate dehydrogenase family protein [Haloplanus litoreus]|uniref:Prephenate dehydrogenase/arogenate dehydrogenase family protein n=1 Tax=Haloplanus litoreus TaxID=767515 RepID=A0ABD6A0P3_9EURY
MDLLVVGAGEMGRWVARTVDRPVALADVDTAAAERAAAALGSEARAVPTDTTETFDAVCLAVPISAVDAAVERYAPRAERAMCDVSGVMAGPVAAMRETLPDRERVSMHPLFAASNAPGNVAVVADAPGPVTDAIRDDVAAAGNHTFETTVEEHDTAMETVQAGAHTAVLAYALAAADVREEFATPVSAAMDDLVATVTGGTPRVYREIQETFDGAGAVADAARRVADAEGDAFDELYREAGE